MRKLFIVSCSVIAILLVNTFAFAVNDLLVPKSEDGKKQWTHFFTPSFRTRIQYDDNCTASNPKYKSWEAINAPRVAFKMPYEKSFIGVNWQYTNIAYAMRPGDKFDNNQDVDMVLRSDLSDRLTVGIKQAFQYRQQPFVPRQPRDSMYPPQSTAVDSAWRWAFTNPNLSENADYGLYAMAFGMDYRINKKLGVDFTYNLERLQFMQSSGIVGPALSNLSHTFMTVLNYRLLPETLFLADVRFLKQDYDEIQKDYIGCIAAGGIKNRIGKSVICNGRLGYEWRKPTSDASYTYLGTTVPAGAIPGAYPRPGHTSRITTAGQTLASDTDQNNENESREPFVEADMTYLFSKSTQVKVGYKLKVVDTEQPSYEDAKVQGVYTSLAHKLTSKTYLLLFASQEARYYSNHRELEANILANAQGTTYFPHETITEFGFLLTQQLKPWMFLELGYKYNDVHSDFSPFGWNTSFGDFVYTGPRGEALNASYTRNRIFSGLNIIF